jgi:hypothetical protein
MSIQYLPGYELRAPQRREADAVPRVEPTDFRRLTLLDIDDALGTLELRHERMLRAYLRHFAGKMNGFKSVAEDERMTTAAAASIVGRAALHLLVTILAMDGEEPGGSTVNRAVKPRRFRGYPRRTAEISGW